MSGGFKWSVAGWMLLAIFILSAAVVFHIDLDGRYRPNCPACQLEHNPGMLASATCSSGVVAAPVVLSFIRAVSQAGVKKLCRTLGLVLCSPPPRFIIR